MTIPRRLTAQVCVNCESLDGRGGPGKFVQFAPSSLDLQSDGGRFYFARCDEGRREMYLSRRGGPFIFCRTSEGWQTRLRLTIPN